MTSAVVAVTVALLCLIWSVDVSPAFLLQERHRRQSFDFGTPPPVPTDNADNAGTGGDLSNPQGDPTGQSFDFGGNADWDKGSDVGTVDNFPTGFNFNFSHGDPSSKDSNDSEPATNGTHSTNDPVPTGSWNPEGAQFDFGGEGDFDTGAAVPVIGFNGPSSKDSNDSEHSTDGTHGMNDLDQFGNWNPEGADFDFGGEGDFDTGATVPVIGFEVPVLPPQNDGVNDGGTNVESSAQLRFCHPNYCAAAKPCAGSSRRICFNLSGCNKTACMGDNVVDSSPVLTTRQPQGSPSLRPLHVRACHNGTQLVCVHGYCGAEGCVCDEPWQGSFCNIKCTLPCVHGTCFIPDLRVYKPPNEYTEEDMICNCEFNYKGPQCDTLIPDPEERARVLAAVLSTAIAVVLILAIIIPIVLWRMRVIFVLKLVYYFKDYEDDDGKLYDAYVSLSPTAGAEKFVYSELRPRLEELGFKLYLQARDSPANEVLSDIILTAVEKSRRTIMIVTPDYVHNEWSRFEFLIAQHETLKLRQRIIPVILEDVAEERANMDKSLKHILDSIKCLRYPEEKGKHSNIYNSTGTKGSISGGERSISSSAGTSKEILKQDKKMSKFWKRLELTMPKKKNEDSSSANTKGQKSKSDKLRRTNMLQKFSWKPSLNVPQNGKLSSSEENLKTGFSNEAYNLSFTFLDIDVTDIFKNENYTKMNGIKVAGGEKEDHEKKLAVDLSDVQLDNHILSANV